MDPHPEHQIAPGIRGWLESPAPDGPASDCLTVSGWAFVRGSTIVGVWTTASGVRRPLQAGLRREDVARIYPDEPAASHSGFAGYLQLEQAPRKRVQLEIWASLSDGRSIRLFKRRVPTVAARHESLLLSAVRQVAQRPATLLSRRSWLNAGRRLAGTSSTEASPDVRLHREGGVPIHGPRATHKFSEDRIATDVHGRLPRRAVSVVVVVWNQAELSLTCLRALVEQSEVPMELIIVDNASTDETPDLLGRLQRSHDHQEPEQSRLHDGTQRRRQGGTRGVPAVPQQRRGADAREHRAVAGDRSRFALHRRGRRKTGISRRPPAGSRVDHLVGRIVRRLRPRRRSGGVSNTISSVRSTSVRPRC